MAPDLWEMAYPNLAVENDASCSGDGTFVGNENPEEDAKKDEISVVASNDSYNKKLGEDINELNIYINKDNYQVYNQICESKIKGSLPEQSGETTH
eukprot:14847135-Ditylum_brightwellii.AAC.1